MRQPPQGLHLCRSQEQFDLLGEAFVTVMEKCGEMEYSSWFEEQYLTAPWNCWHVTASGVPGVLPNQNVVRATWPHTGARLSAIEHQLLGTLPCVTQWTDVFSFVACHVPCLRSLSRSMPSSKPEHSTNDTVL